MDFGFWRQAFQNLSPQHSGSPHLGYFHEVVLALIPEEGQTLGESIHRQSCFFTAANVFHAISQGITQFQVAGSATFLDVVAGNGNGIELGHVLGGVFEDIADDTHGHGRRIDVGVADHEFLQDIVLDGALEDFPIYPLLNAGADEESQDGKHGAIHSHGYGHLVQRDTVKEDIHIQHRAYRYACLAHIAYYAGVIRIVAPVRRKVECNGQPLLSGSQVSLIKGVGFFGCGEAGILTYCPWTEYIHGGVGASQERRNAAHEIQMIAFLINIFGIQRAYGDTLQGGVVQIIVGFARRFFQPCFPDIVITGRMIFQVQFCEIGIHCHIILPPLP